MSVSKSVAGILAASAVTVSMFALATPAEASNFKAPPSASNFSVAGTVTTSSNFQNLHSFCSFSNSTGSFLTAFEKNGPRKTVVSRNQCGRGDWIYVPTGKEAVNSAKTLSQGWHYDSGIIVDSYRLQDD
jgi:hypothetical protein